MPLSSPTHNSILAGLAHFHNINNKTMIALYDVSFESEDCLRADTVITEIRKGDVDERTDLKLRFRYLSEPTVQPVNGLIKALADWMGAKHIFAWIDAVVADAYESCQQRTATGLSLNGQGQISWLHEWIGAFVVSEKVSPSPPPKCWTRYKFHGLLRQVLIVGLSHGFRLVGVGFTR